VRLFGKGKPYSGKRVRVVPLTPLALEVLRVFEKIFKPMFPRANVSDYLFLNENGDRLTKPQYYRNFRKMVELAREAGLPIPEDLRPHDLRRTFATNELEQNPLAYRKVLRKLGHTYPSSAAPYLIATDADVEDQQSDLIDIFVNPSVEKRRKN
jgi:integrase